MKIKIFRSESTKKKAEKNIYVDEAIMHKSYAITLRKCNNQLRRDLKTWSTCQARSNDTDVIELINLIKNIWYNY